MLFMNMARLYGSVYMEAAPADGGAGGGGPAAPATTTAPSAPATTTPATTTEPAPTTPVTPENKATDTPADNGMQTFIDQHQESNPALSLALGFLRDAGISPTDPAFTKAEVEGDFTLLKAILATKQVPGTEAMVSILEKAVSDHQAAIEAQEAKTTEVVTSILGEGKDVIMDWVRSNADQTEKDAFNEMLAAGGVYARAAAVLMKDAYTTAGKTVPAKSAIQQGQAPSAGAGPLTAREFSEQVQALSKAMRGDPRGSQQYADLSRRRAVGRQNGI